MSVGASYVSRFFVKFVEIIAAGLATAVSAYLIAPLGGHLSAPAPATVQVGATASEISKSLSTQPTPPAATAASEQRLAPQQDADASAAQPARKAVQATKATLPRKPIKSDASMAERKPRGEESVEVLVRAALVNVDANRPAPPDVPPHQADVPPRPAAVEAESRPADVQHGAAAIATAPRAADVQPQPVQPRSVQPGPLTPVDIKSRPVASIEALPPIPTAPIEVATPQPAPPAEEDKGVFSLKRIPDWLRPEPARAGEAPRPPMPVGQFAQGPM
jgi:hypothetical protein